MGWEYVPLEDTPLEGSLLVVGMPSMGAVGPVTAAFLAEHLRMRVIGGFQSEDMPPVGVVRKGMVTSPFQVWATEQACGLDGRCDRLLVLRGDAPLELPAMSPVASAIARWAAQQGIALLVSLEGYPAGKGPATAPGTGGAGGAAGLMVAASQKGLDAARRLGAQPVEEATLTGFTAALLVRSNRERLPALGLFAPVASEEGDVGAAVTLMRVVDPLVPNIRLSPADLAKKAEDVEGRLRKDRQRQAEATRRMEDQVARGYV